MNKPDLSRCLKFIDDGFSLLTVGAGKKPNFSWKREQTKAPTKLEFEHRYNYTGGRFFERKLEDGTMEQCEIESTKGVGIITGYKDLEVIDVDLKIFETLKDQQEFWNEYCDYLRESIDDFDNKIVIYKTINNGYHLLYKCSKIAGNVKIAKIKGHKEAVIESRGIGGYVWMYDNQISKNGYDAIKYISEKERDLIWDISRHFGYIEQQPIAPHAIVKSQIKSDITVWEDYNQKNRIWDLICDEFDIVKKLYDRLIIKRHGATSASSGSIFLKDNKMFLFSTGTNYPAEKPLSPFDIYAIRYFFGDYSAAAKDLYKKNYGERYQHETKMTTNVSIKEDVVKKEDLKKVDFPIDIFPDDLQAYMTACNDTLNSSFDYMGCAFLWVLSLIIGNSVKIKVKGGWIESGTVWISLVGEAGIGKTPSTNRIISPLKKINNLEIKRYIKHREKFEEYSALDKKDKKNCEEVKKPIKTQIIVSDFTVEAITDLHEENKNAIGVFCDELAGWYKDMNKYRAGSDLEFWLSSWSNEGIAVNRKTAKSSFVESPILPVLGGIQPKILTQFFTEENKDNGFIDRMLTTYPDLTVDEYNDDELDDDTIEFYNDYVINFYDTIKNTIIKKDAEDEIIPIIADLSSGAKRIWIRLFNEITGWQNGDNENEYMKSMYPKQKSYIPRFALLLNTLYWKHDANRFKLNSISEEAMIGAEKLFRYFVYMAKKHKIETTEYCATKKIIEKNEAKTTAEKINEILVNQPDIKASTIASLLGISKRRVYELIKKRTENATKTLPDRNK